MDILDHIELKQKRIISDKSFRYHGMKHITKTDISCLERSAPGSLEEKIHPFSGDLLNTN